MCNPFGRSTNLKPTPAQMKLYRSYFVKEEPVKVVIVHEEDVEEIMEFSSREMAEQFYCGMSYGAGCFSGDLQMYYGDGTDDDWEWTSDELKEKIAEALEDKDE